MGPWYSSVPNPSFAGGSTVGVGVGVGVGCMVSTAPPPSLCLPAPRPSQVRMSQLEVKEKELNKLKQESDQLVLNQHPASDKIEVGRWRAASLGGKRGCSGM